MASLKDMCDMVDDFVSDGTSSQIEGASEFWKLLNKDAAAAQLYAECLIYKYIALSYGLGNKPLFQTLSQIKNISVPSGHPGSSESGSPSPASSPRGSLVPPGKSKRGSGNFDPPEAKSTPKKKFNIGRRKSEDSKKSRKELAVENQDPRRKSKSKNSSKSATLETPESKDESSSETQPLGLDNVLLSLTYIAKMCDLTRWDFSKLREVFLTWNKVRGWEQSASDYEYAVMKKFSMSPPANIYGEEQVRKHVTEVLHSVNKVPDEFSISDSKNVGESIKYWEIRHKILTRPEEAVSVIECLTLLAKKIADDGDETKILPLLHILCETIIMSPHTPLELLQECYSTFEQFYVWPSYVAHPVKEVLDMIQMEMKCPGHFYRMIFFQDSEIPLSEHLAAKMPSSETHIFIDEDVPESEALSEAFRKLRETRSAKSKVTTETGVFRFVIRHIFESVFGSGCCDLSTLENALQVIPDDDASELCHEALAIMEEASMKQTHGQAQDFLRAELEIFSDKITDYLEVDLDKENDEGSESDSPKQKQPSFRRVSVLYETSRARDSTGSPMRASFSSGQIGTPSPRRNNSYLRRNTSGSLDNPLGARKLASKASALAKETPAELIGAKVSTLVFNHADLSDTVYELVRNTSKEYVQEKKRSSRFSTSRKRDAHHLNEQDAYRDSGVIDDEEPSDAMRNLATGVQHLRIEETDEEEAKDQEESAKTVLSASSSNEDSEASTKQESDNFWKEFLEKGFDSENEELIELLKTMTFDQRKSFIIENKLKKRQSECGELMQPTIVPISLTPPASPTIVIEPESPQTATTNETQQTPPKSDTSNAEQDVVIMRRQSSKNEHKKLQRLSRFVRNKRRSTKKGRSDGELDKMSSAESLSSVSSTPSSTTSEEMSDSSSLRVRTGSDPIFRNKKRAKWSSSPLVSRSKKNRLSVDVTPRSPFNLSVRSLPGRERVSLFGNDVFGEASPLREDDSIQPVSPGGKGAGTPTTPTRASFQLGDMIDDESRRRIDSGIGPENVQDLIRRRTASSFSIKAEHEDHGIGGVQFAVKEVQRANRRHRMSVSDDLDERPVYKKVLKLVFVGNDKTVGHMARAYYELRKRQMSRAPLFQHVDLRLFFIPVSSVSMAEKEDSSEYPGSCDIRVGELLGTYDSWYHTVVTLSVNNLLRVYPKISAGDETKDNQDESSPEKQIPTHKLLAPHEVIASALLSYCRFAVSRTYISMYKVAMVSSTGDVFTDVFACQLKIGHEAYTTAVKAGRFGKLGKLVDLTNDSGPPPAFTKIEYSKWSIDGQLIFTGQLPETFYHTVCVTPMSLCKNHFRGTDVLQLILVDNEKRQKVVRRTSSNKLTSLEEAEVAGNVLDIGTMKIEVMRPTQGTFSLILDDSKIYTSIKSVEIVPCGAPEAEISQNNRKIASRHLREHSLIRLPLRTFWPASQ